MPMPRLLKRLSEKSLRKRSQSMELIPDDQRHLRTTSEPVPPLPPSQTTQIDSSFRVLTPPSILKTLNRSSSPLSLDGGGEASHRPSPNGRALTLPLSLPSANGAHNDLSEDLAAAWGMANNDPKMSQTDKVLQKIEGEALAAQGHQVNATAAITGITTVLDATGGMQAIEQGVNHFLEGSAVLMNALDEVSKLHPFIGVAVMAFKAVYTLEMKRRENDKKIIALHVEMKDMMAVLVQLKHVQDIEEVAPDGSTIKGRMEELVHGTAKDIKACANTCDTYSKKKLVAKVLKGPVWEPRLLKFVSLFTKRRSEFEFTLTIHTSLGVDAANKKLNDVDKTTQEINAKMDLMMKMFQSFIPPEEKEIASLIKQKGGPKACEGSDKLLKELSELEQKKGYSAAGGSHAGRKAGGKSSDLDDLKEDLHGDPDVAVEKNMSVFSRKFEVQKRQITDEMERVVKREGDRVINAVTSGPHDKIIDPDVHKVWQEMGWRGSVKARHFVMGLRDYFQEKWGSDSHPADGVTARIADNHRDDKWALAYLNVVRLQPISEAFDDDASGFVTVAEVNTFTTSRPLGWSLPHWIAYWAIGWHQSLSEYASKIRDIIAKMFAILPTIMPANRASVNEYLLCVYEGVTTLSSSVNPCYINNTLQARFRTYVDAEEARLKGNLEAVDYDIDAENTLALVTGPGRIERFVLPLIYLLLKRHFEIFRICRTQTVSSDELPDATGTISYVFHAVAERVDVLQSISKQQKLDLKQQFKTFAHGIFEYWDEPKLIWNPEIVRTSEFPEYPYDDDTEEKDIKIKDILNYDVDQEELDVAVYYVTTQDGPPPYVEASSPLSAVLGVWNGFIYCTPTDMFPTAGMISMTLLPSTAEGQNQRFQASGRSNGRHFTVSGECSWDETGDSINITFERKFPGSDPTQYWHGQWDGVTEAITGTWGSDPDPTTQQAIFILKRTAPEHLRFRPAPMVFEANKARALWSFALSAIRYHIRQQSWSWSFFDERRKLRERFIELYIRDTEFGPPLDQTEDMELCRTRQTFTTADSQFYHSLAEHQIRKRTKHGRACDNCMRMICGARIICLFCHATDTWNPVDLCETSDCLTAWVERDDLPRPHLPTHDIIKVRRLIHIRQFGKLDREAKAALKNARTVFERDRTQGPITSSTNNPFLALDGAQKRASTNVNARPKCALCKRRATQPCWYCVQCEGDVFICNDCDAKGPASFGDHNGIHDLVRCQELVEDVDTSIEDRLANLEECFGTMDKRLVQLESKMDDGLASVKSLLVSLLGKMGVEPA